MADTEKLPVQAKHPSKTVSIVPVGLKEAALDSPSFRAAALHFSEQVDTLERWLDGFVKAAAKLSHEASALDSLVNSFVANSVPPQSLSETVVDHDFALLAVKRFSEAAKDFWAANVAELKKMDTLVAEPIRNFLQLDIRNFKETRRQLEQSQKTFDQLQTRYSAQVKTKEPSSLREDAFQLHESRKAYLRSSMDFSTSASQLKFTLDKSLIGAFSEQSKAMRTSREGSNVLFARWSSAFERIRSWSKEIELGEKAFRQEFSNARKQIEEAAEQATRPSRELEDYAQSATVSLANRGPSTFAALKPSLVTGGKQGWLNVKTSAGKPARTAWVRRWFYVKNGIFGWLVQGSRSGGVEESEKIGVLLCGLRPATSEERRFCFEVKTKDVTIVLQADSQNDILDWMAAFNFAKQRALEDPSSTTISPSGPPVKQALDLAFAISPPSAPEFTASAIDAGLAFEDNHDRSTSLSLSVPNEGNAPAYRRSIDMSPGRRSTGIDSDNSREQTGKIMQKLDLRRPTTGFQGGAAAANPGTAGASPSTGGIASLISASHMTLPLAPNTTSHVPSLEMYNRLSNAPAKVNLSSVLKSLPSSTLAPSTLANPPNATNLSATAVMVSSEKGIGIGKPDATGTTPSGPLANFWGSFNWGYIDYLEHDEAFNLAKEKPVSSNNQAVENTDTVENDLGGAGSRLGPSHRKTISLDGDAADFQRAVLAHPEFPNYYPPLLRYHDAQFRLLFPSARKENRLVLVFRAIWSSKGQQEFPGRVFVTSKDIHFYSNHVGLVLTTGLSLASISEATAASGRECGFLFLHLCDSNGTDHARITIKTFLEPLTPLERRLNFLIHNSNSETPESLENIVKTMIKLEHTDDEDERSPSLDSNEGTPNIALDMQPAALHETGKDLRYRPALVDQDLHRSRGVEKDMSRLKLPSKPVNYTPMGMATPVAEKVFGVSTKALFHLLFGDRSAVWQLLYHERRALNIRQGPWVQQNQAYLRRTFEYNVEYIDLLGRVRRADMIDIQTVDVNSDHLCYVVTDRKTPWHLLYNGSYVLLSKIVITHVAKSRCKLAVYTKVDWSKQPFLIENIMERRATAELTLDALDLLDVVSEQVSRLGPQSNTKRAVHIFGAIGQETQTIEFKGSDRAVLPRTRYMVSRTVPQLVTDYIVSHFRNLLASILMYTFSLPRWIYKTFNAHVFIISLLFLSVLANTFLSSNMLLVWWQEQKAQNFMRNLGIGQDLVISKSISLGELHLSVSQDEEFAHDENDICYLTFKGTSRSGDYSHHRAASTQRIRRTREHLGQYRHDFLVAMRVVNTIEQEMARAEWETWVLEETDRCAQADKLLLERNKSSKNSTQGDGYEYLLRYCSSCGEAKQRLLVST